MVPREQGTKILAATFWWRVTADHELLLQGQLYFDLTHATEHLNRLLSTRQDEMASPEKLKKELQGIHLARFMKTLPDREIA